MKFFHATIFLILFYLNGNTQNNFEKVYYFGIVNAGEHIIQTSDGNFLFASGGASVGFDHSYFVKINPNGNVIWMNDYTTSFQACGKWVAETTNNKYVLLNEESYNDPLAVAIRQTNTNGILNWTLKYPSPHPAPYHSYSPEQFEQTSDGGFIITGTKSFSYGDTCFLMSVSNNGTLNWYKNILDTLKLGGKYVKQTIDSGYVVLANYISNSIYSDSTQLIKLSVNGNVLWNKKINNFIGNTIIIDSNNDFLLSGSSLNSSGKLTPSLLKYSATGNNIWSSVYQNNTNRNIISYSMIMPEINKFSIAVQSEKIDSSKRYAIVLHTDSTLNLVSSDTVNLTKTNSPIFDLSISSLQCGGYCLIGSIDTLGGYPQRTFVKVNYDKIIINASSNGICLGTPDTLTAIGMANNFLWSPSTGLSSTTGATVIAIPAEKTTYYLTASLNGGCIKNDTVTVTVVAANAGNDTSLCTNNSVAIGTAGLTGVSYFWQPIAGLSNSAIAQPLVTPSATTTYTVTALAAGCIQTDSVIIIVFPSISVDAGNDVAIIPGTNTTLVGVSNSGSTFIWSPSTYLSCNTCTSPISSPITTTTYILTATKNSCSSSDTVTVFVDTDCGELFVPNVFSPNADGENDVLKIYGNCISSIDLLIFDRWGEKVFESKDINSSWDGTFNGQKLNETVFVYSLIATVNGLKVEKHGNISLVR